MSTKTTFKRIALVTVAALGFGTMAAVSPASAAYSTLTSVKVSDATVYGFVGETLTAKVLVQAVGATNAALSSDDSITLTARLTSSSPTNVVAPDSVTVESATPATASLNKFRFVESTTASPYFTTVLTPLAAEVASNAITIAATAALDTKTAAYAAKLDFRPIAAGTYKMTVTPSNYKAGVSPTYTAGVITFVVLSLGAAGGDGGVLSPYNAAGGVAGAGNYNQVRVTGQIGTAALGTRVVVTGSTFDAVLAGTGPALSADKTTMTIPGALTGGTLLTGLVNVLTPTVGTITVNSYRETSVGTYSSTADATVTITVRAAAVSGTYSYQETWMSTSDATVPSKVTDAAIVATPIVTASLPVSGTAIAQIEVDQYDALDGAVKTDKTQAVTAEISGAGRIGTTTNGSNATSFVAVAAGSTAAPQSATSNFYVFNDGRSGVATITIKVGGVTTLTRSISFTGTATQLKLVAATASAPNPSKSFLAVDGTMTISVLPYDANNVKMSAVTVRASSDTATVATVLSTDYASGVVTVTGVAVGKTNINICVGACSTATIKMVVPVEVTKSTGKAVLTLDKTSAQPGEKVTWTITATDVNGRPTADGTSVALFSSITSNMSVTGLPTGTETLTGGISTGSFFAPTAGSGTLTITATQGTAHDTYIAGLKAATAAGTTYTAVKDVVSMAIVNAATDAAQAAAEEATAAANDATDAALSAAEAAEAATAMAQEAVDAVAELSAQVTSLISALRAQITALTNLVVKIQKKVKA